MAFQCSWNQERIRIPKKPLGQKIGARATMSRLAASARCTYMIKLCHQDWQTFKTVNASLWTFWRPHLCNAQSLSSMSLGHSFTLWRGHVSGVLHLRKKKEREKNLFERFVWTSRLNLFEFVWIFATKIFDSGCSGSCCCVSCLSQCLSQPWFKFADLERHQHHTCTKFWRKLRTHFKKCIYVLWTVLDQVSALCAS